MANDFTATDGLAQNAAKHNMERTMGPQARQFSKGVTVFKKDTGMAFKIGNMSHANGIEHFNLRCAKTGSSFYLSKFALETDYTLEDAKLEKVGLRMVRRLSEMWSKQTTERNAYMSQDICFS